MPNGTIQLDYNSQQTFTCSVTGVEVQWIISGLSGRSVRGSGTEVANSYGSITTNDATSITQSSTINIMRIRPEDHGATVRCVNKEDESVQGVAILTLGKQITPLIINYHTQ